MKNFQNIRALLDSVEWLGLFEQANSLDWRVGFLLRCRDGRFFRAIRKNGKLIRCRA